MGYIDDIRQHIERDPEGWNLGPIEALPEQLKRMERAIDARDTHTAKDVANWVEMALKHYPSRLDGPAPDGVLSIIDERITAARSLPERRQGNL